MTLVTPQVNLQDIMTIYRSGAARLGKSDRAIFIYI